MAKPWEVAGQNAPWKVAGDNAARRAAAPAKAREAFEASRNSPESVAARERDAQHPVRQYMGDWGGRIAGAFKDLYSDYNPIKHSVGTIEGVTSALTGAASIVPGALDLAMTNLVPDPQNPEQSLMKAMEKYTYSPRSETGEDFNEAMGAVFKPLGDVLAPDTVASAAEDYGVDPATAASLGDKLGPSLGTIPVGAGAPAAGRMAARTARGIAPKTAELLDNPTPPPMEGPPLPKAATEPGQVARAADIRLPPSSVPGAKGSMLESTVGTPQARAHAALRNQPTINRHAVEELGLKGPQRFSEQTFRNLEVEPLKVYDEVESTVPRVVFDDELQAAVAGVGKAQRDNPLLEVAPAVEALHARLSKQDNTIATADVRAAVRDWRFKAKKLFQSMDDPAKHEQASAYLQAADSFESAIERQAAAVGKGDLGKRFKEARTKLAKIYDYETAMVDGNIDVSILSKMKEKGRPLSGRAAMLADIGRWFPQETQQGSMVRVPQRDSVPFWRSVVGRGAQILARKPVDDILFSERYQSQFGDVDAAPGPGSPLGAYFSAPEAPPPPPKAPTPQASGSVDFERSPEVPPVRAFKQDGRMEFARDESGDAAIPAAEGNLGDLTASQAPAPEGIPFVASPEVPAVQGRRAPAPVDADMAPETGFFPGAEVPPNAAMTEFVSDQPINRRREGGRPLVEGPIPPTIGGERAFIDDGNPMTAPGRPGDPDVLELGDYPLPDRSAERARVLAGDTFNADTLLGDLFAKFPDLEREVRGDTIRNATEAANRRITDRGGRAPERTADTPNRRADDPVQVQEGLEPGNMTPEAIQQTRDTLAELGFTPEEIEAILTRGRE